MEMHASEMLIGTSAAAVTGGKSSGWVVKGAGVAVGVVVGLGNEVAVGVGVGVALGAIVAVGAGVGVEATTVTVPVIAAP
jgi:hypothetical protein